MKATPGELRARAARIEAIPGEIELLETELAEAEGRTGPDALRPDALRNIRDLRERITALRQELIDLTPRRRGRPTKSLLETGEDKPMDARYRKQMFERMNRLAEEEIARLLRTHVPEASLSGIVGDWIARIEKRKARKA